MGPRVVTPKEYADAMDIPIRRLQNTYGCILAIDEQGRSVTKGTAVFISVGEHRFLVTARHVVRSEKMVGRQLLLMFSPLGPDGLAVSGEQVVPISVRLEMEIVAESEPLDVAFLRAPETLWANPAAKFLDGRTHADVTTNLRARWRNYASETSTLPYVVLGFPNFGHLVESVEQRIETLSASVLPAEVTQFDAYPWDGHSRPAPQLFLKIDASEQGLVLERMSERLLRMTRKLFHPEADEPEPLGGFSGGAVAVVGDDGEFLLGIIKQGTQLFGTLRMAASCWDDCFVTFGRSVASRV